MCSEFSVQGSASTLANEHRTLNAEHRTPNVKRCIRNAAGFVFFFSFDPPEADKCLLACGELDVGCSMFNVHLSRELISYKCLRTN